MPFLLPNQPRQSTEGKGSKVRVVVRLPDQCPPTSEELGYSTSLAALLYIVSFLSARGKYWYMFVSVRVGNELLCKNSPDTICPRPLQMVTWTATRAFSLYAIIHKSFIVKRKSCAAPPGSLNGIKGYACHAFHASFKLPSPFYSRLMVRHGTDRDWQTTSG